MALEAGEGESRKNIIESQRVEKKEHKKLKERAGREVIYEHKR
jgi:hypothetical protein